MHVEYAMQERQLQQHDGRVVHEELRLLDSRLQRRLRNVELHVEQVWEPELVLDQRGGIELLLPWMHHHPNCTPYPGTTCKSATTTAGTAVSACAR